MIFLKSLILRFRASDTYRDEFSEVYSLRLENKRLHAHKCILDQRSPAFVAMFRQADKYSNRRSKTHVREKSQRQRKR